MAAKRNIVINSFDCKSTQDFLQQIKKLNPEGNFLLKRNQVLLYKNNGVKQRIKVPHGYLLKGNYIINNAKQKNIRLKKVPFLPRK